jgi:hypothetical protein
VQLARCQRELGKLDLARGALQRARATIDRIPADADFTQATPYERAFVEAHPRGRVIEALAEIPGYAFGA